jgi:hypothetical protein
MKTWPFPPPTGPIPWTPEQLAKYKKDKQNSLPSSPIFKK